MRRRYVFTESPSINISARVKDSLSHFCCSREIQAWGWQGARTLGKARAPLPYSLETSGKARFLATCDPEKAADRQSTLELASKVYFLYFFRLELIRTGFALYEEEAEERRCSQLRASRILKVLSRPQGLPALFRTTFQELSHEQETRT